MQKVSKPRHKNKPIIISRIPANIATNVGIPFSYIKLNQLFKSTNFGIKIQDQMLLLTFSLHFDVNLCHKILLTLILGYEKYKFKIWGLEVNITALFFKTGHSNYKLFSVYNFYYNKCTY